MASRFNKKEEFGISKNQEYKIKAKFGLNLRTFKPMYIEEPIFNQISKYMHNNIDFGYKYKINIQNSVYFLESLSSNRGIRLQKGYPTRGQRTHTNARTSKKKNR